MKGLRSTWAPFLVCPLPTYTHRRSSWCKTTRRYHGKQRQRGRSQILTRAMFDEMEAFTNLLSPGVASVATAMIAVTSVSINLYGGLLTERKRADLAKQVERERQAAIQIREMRSLVARYRGPLLEAAVDLESRLVAVATGRTARGGGRGVVEEEVVYTLFTLAQFLGFVELVRREGPRERSFLQQGNPQGTDTLANLLEGFRFILCAHPSALQAWYDEGDGRDHPGVRSRPGVPYGEITKSLRAHASSSPSPAPSSAPSCGPGSSTNTHNSNPVNQDSANGLSDLTDAAHGSSHSPSTPASAGQHGSSSSNPALRSNGNGHNGTASSERNNDRITSPDGDANDDLSRIGISSSRNSSSDDNSSKGSSRNGNNGAGPSSSPTASLPAAVPAGTAEAAEASKNSTSSSHGTSLEVGSPSTNSGNGSSSAAADSNSSTTSSGGGGRGGGGCGGGGVKSSWPGGNVLHMSRGTQRAVGGMMIITPLGASRHYTLSYSDFYRRYYSDPSLSSWLRPIFNDLVGLIGTPGGWSGVGPFPVNSWTRLLLLQQLLADTLDLLDPFGVRTPAQHRWRLAPTKYAPLPNAESYKERLRILESMVDTAQPSMNSVFLRVGWARSARDGNSNEYLGSNANISDKLYYVYPTRGGSTSISSGGVDMGNKNPSSARDPYNRNMAGMPYDSMDEPDESLNMPYYGAASSRGPNGNSSGSGYVQDIGVLGSGGSSSGFGPAGLKPAQNLDPVRLSVGGGGGGGGAMVGVSDTDTGWQQQGNAVSYRSAGTSSSSQFIPSVPPPPTALAAPSGSVRQVTQLPSEVVPSGGQQQQQGQGS